MKRISTLALSTLAAGLVACGQQQAAETESATTTEAATTAAAAPAGGSDMAAMNMSGAATIAKSTGTVTAVDAAAGTITIDHAPIPEVNWPAMTMAFKASPEVAGQVAAGDKIAFDVKLAGGSGEVTAVQKQ